MKNNLAISVALTVVIASLAIMGGTYAWRSLSEKQISPAETVQNFYSQWVGYEGNPLVDEVYKNNPYLSDEFTEKIDQTRASFAKTAFDPIICAQDKPIYLEITNVAKKDDSAIVTFTEEFSGGDKTLEALMIKKGNNWLIKDVICDEGELNRENDFNSDVSPAIQNQVGKYIRNNISDLSPKSEVLGGTFQVNSIRFTSADTCVVDYEDGHIALTAEAEFEVPGADEVNIKSFELMEDIKTEKAGTNFNETGNLTLENSEWHLVYEKPGKPALRVKLKFNKNSVCVDESPDGSCDNVYWSVGDRAQVTGQKEGDVLEVFSLRLVGENSKNISGEVLSVTNFDECESAGYEVLYPECEGCKPYCETPGGERFEKVETDKTGFCEDLCGNGVCEEMVCMAEGCPCAESSENCPEDCK